MESTPAWRNPLTIIAEVFGGGPGSDPKMLRWRIQTFIVTYIAYAGFYLTRVNYTTAQLEFTQEFGWTKEQIGIIGTVYLTVYAAGQFINGILVDKVGARRLLMFGFTLTGLMSIGMGLSSSIPMMALLYGVNGYAQSTGWCSNARTMTLWSPVVTRGRLMGFWGTTYSIGSFVAKALAAVLIGWVGWRLTMIIPGIMAFGLAIMIYFFLRNSPEDVGLEIDGEEDDNADDNGTGEAKETSAFAETLEILLRPRILVLGSAYFCMKFVRYTFMFWIGFYLIERFGFNASQSGWVESAFPFFGAIGIILGGWLSDLVFQTRRAPPAAIMLFCLVLALLYMSGMQQALMWEAVAIMGVIGVSLYGPDMLISGTAAMDFGSAKAAGRVVGFVNGMGSIGAALQGVVIGFVSERYGWDSVFTVLIVMVLVSIGVTSTLWKQKATK